MLVADKEPGIVQAEIELKELKAFFSTAKRLNYSKGELILRADEIPKGVYLIESGIIKIYALSRHNDQHIHHFFGPGDFFPITWIFQELTTNLYYYECVEPVVVSLVPKDDFLEFVMKNENVMLEMLEEIVLHYIRYSGRIENLLYSNSLERCAYRLLSLGNRFGGKLNGNLVINANITHEDLARSLNMTRETFSRALSRMQQKGVVGYDSSHHIVINDLKYLVKIIGHEEATAMWPNINKYLTEAS